MCFKNIENIFDGPELADFNYCVAVRSNDD